MSKILFRAPALLATSSILFIPLTRSHVTMKNYKITPFDSTRARWDFTTSDFRRADESPDDDFYNMPRFVHHIDDNAVKCLTDYYTAHLPSQEQTSILDICSSWVSHLPSSTATTHKVHGIGMNKHELSKNPVLTSYDVQDLNTNTTIHVPEPLLPISMTICTVSIDYLNQPLAILEHIARQTKPGGTIHIAISNRCFPTKVVRWWTRTSEPERLDGVCRYLHFAGADVTENKKDNGGGLWERIEIVEVVGEGSEEGESNYNAHEGVMGWFNQFRRNDPLWIVRAVRSSRSL